ncbi:MAG: uroporphyrinogen decarboxylase family protein [Clostridia bacterium]|nr:uroporphyrinogen decarboxylase family protein [Clostridia bacterium]
MNSLFSDYHKPMPILSYPGCEKAGFKVSELSFDSDKQAQVMKAVADRCDSLAAVTLMDLSVEAECFGADVIISEAAVPAVTGVLLKEPGQAYDLPVPKVGEKRSGIYIDAVKKAKQLIKDRPVIAGAAAPFSLAARLFGVTETMLLCYDEPEAVKAVLKKCTEFIIEYITALKAAGADGVILAEPVSGLLSPALEEEFSAPYIKLLADAVKSSDFAVIYHNCGANVSRMTASIFSNGCDAYHFGNAVNMRDMLSASPASVPVMGNLDPVGLFKDGTPVQMKNAVNNILSDCREYKNFILSSGCDIPPGAKWENISAFFESARDFSYDL